MISSIQAHRTIQGATVLEVGAGWEPLLPILFRAAGARRVILTDLHRLFDPATIKTAQAHIARNTERIADKLAVSPETVSAASDDAASFEYLAPCDCRALPLPNDSIDIIFSRDTLEHVTPAGIAGIFRESARALRADGVACHFIDLSDHWSHRNRAISRVNFLRYREWLFRLMCLNPLLYHNRLRAPEYLDLVRREGLELIDAEGYVDPGAVAALKELPVVPRFARFSAEDLATTDLYLLAKRSS